VTARHCHHCAAPVSVEADGGTSIPEPRAVESPPGSPRHHSSSPGQAARRGTFFPTHERVRRRQPAPRVGLFCRPSVRGNSVARAGGSDSDPRGRSFLGWGGRASPRCCGCTGGETTHTDSPASTAPIPTGHAPHIGATVSDAGSSMSTIRDMHDSVDDELQVRR
jgi:hypothetical protein